MFEGIKKLFIKKPSYMRHAKFIRCESCGKHVWTPYKDYCIYCYRKIRRLKK
jgi:uncharacterized OB-fold protein